MRIGLIGAGAVADLHTQAIARLPDVRLTAVCDVSHAAAERIAAPEKAAVFTDYQDLLGGGSIDAVIVNTPHALHTPMVLDAARLGLHVLVEKPMATTTTDCDRMIEACTLADVALVVGHIQHFLPDKRAAEAALADGALGKPLMVFDRRSTDYRPGTRPEWFFSPHMAGGGALMNIGAHCVDRAIWLAGSPAVSLSAATVQRYEMAVETDGALQLGLADGGTVSISVASDTPRLIDEVTVICERGTVVADPRRGTLLRQNGRTRRLHTPAAADIPQAFHTQLADFAATVAGGRSRVSLEHSRHVVELVLAAYDSAAKGRPVPVGRATGAESAPANTCQSDFHMTAARTAEKERSTCRTRTADRGLPEISPDGEC